MAKWYGQIGFVITHETDTDVWTEDIIEHPYYGDILRNSRTSNADNQINEGFNISNQISFVADPYARENFYRMKYVTIRGIKWKITGADVESFPRIIINVGGLWNGS